MTEQMRIIFVSCPILRDRDTPHNDFLQFISGRNDLPSDGSREPHFSLASFET